MDGIHDLGGMAGFGPIRTSRDDDEVFLHDWERRAMAMTFVSFVRGLSNGGQFRHTIERMDPGHYLTSRYYEHWFTAVLSRLCETGVLDDDAQHALEAAAGGALPRSGAEHRSAVADAERALSQTVPTAPSIGTRVRVTVPPRAGHTRCPAYVRGKAGTVVRVDPEASLPDLEAHIDGRRSEPMCTVRFDATELWGPSAEQAQVHVDLWVSYLSVDEERDDG